jgi:hypothetical protein
VKFDIFVFETAGRSIDAQLTAKEMILAHMTVIAVGAPMMPP